MYVQCLLRSLDRGEPGSVMVAWIPEEFAFAGKEIQIKDVLDLGSELWTPYQVDQAFYREKMDTPLYSEARIREHRKNTGDSLPKNEASNN